MRKKSCLVHSEQHLTSASPLGLSPTLGAWVPLREAKGIGRFCGGKPLSEIARTLLLGLATLSSYGARRSTFHSLWAMFISAP